MFDSVECLMADDDLIIYETMHFICSESCDEFPSWWAFFRVQCWLYFRTRALKVQHQLCLPIFQKRESLLLADEIPQALVLSCLLHFENNTLTVLFVKYLLLLIYSSFLAAPPSADVSTPATMTAPLVEEVRAATSPSQSSKPSFRSKRSKVVTFEEL